MQRKYFPSESGVFCKVSRYFLCLALPCCISSDKNTTALNYKVSFERFVCKAWAKQHIIAHRGQGILSCLCPDLQTNIPSTHALHTHVHLYTPDVGSSFNVPSHMYPLHCSSTCQSAKRLSKVPRW